jgi:hypothetical protein
VNAHHQDQVAVGWKGLSAAVLLEAGVTRGSDWTVRVPYRDATGATHNAKMFSPGGKTWWETAGLAMLPFGLERVAQPEHRDKRLLWIAEGESDALALREHFAEWRRHPVDVLGLPGAGTWRREWQRHVNGYRAVFCFPDGDEAGRRMASAIAGSAPWVIRVFLSSGEDVRGVLQQQGPERLDEYLIRAEAVAIYHAGMVLHPELDAFERFLRDVEW